MNKWQQEQSKLKSLLYELIDKDHLGNIPLIVILESLIMLVEDKINE